MASSYFKTKTKIHAGDLIETCTPEETFNQGNLKVLNALKSLKGYIHRLL